MIWKWQRGQGGELAALKSLPFSFSPTGIKSRRRPISQWKKIPAERAHLISELTGIPLHDLRPDLWPRGDAA
jgi:hypothetical protein